MAAPDATAARRRALLVATTTYADERLGQLRAPAGDAQALGAVLEDPAIGGFEVELAVDQPRDAVSQAIERFFGEAKPSDLLLLYVSGHGILARNRLYFATTTTDMAYVGSTAIPEGFVADAMEGSRSRSIVLMLDCCHSGAFQSGLRPKAATEVHPEHRFQGRGRITLSASSKLEYAFEEQAVEAFAPSAPGSLFTRFLVDGLRTGAADLDGDGEISIDEVYDYICDRVKGHGASQTPGKSGEVRGDLVIARSGRRGGVPIELRRALNSPDHGLRALVLGELARRAAASEEGATPAVVEAIREMLDDGHPAVAAAARDALALVEGGSPAPEALAETPPPAEPPAPEDRRPAESADDGYVTYQAPERWTPEPDPEPPIATPVQREPLPPSPPPPRYDTPPRPWPAIPPPQSPAALSWVLADGASPPPRLRVAPGSVGVLTAVIRNQSGIVDSYSMRIDGLPDEYWTVEPERVFLVPFGSGGSYEQELAVRIHPPRESAATAGVWPLTLQADSVGHGGIAAATAELEVEFETFSALELSIQPGAAFGRRGASFTVSVDNVGNAVDRAELAFSDVYGLLEGEFADPVIEVAPGTRAQTTLRVRPVRRLVRGRPQPRFFEVSAKGRTEMLGYVRATAIYHQVPVLSV